MVQNPVSNDFERPVSQELLALRREVELAYEPININPVGSPKSSTEVGQTVLDAAAQPTYLDQLLAASEAESMTPEQKLILMGVNIQAMRKNALKAGRLDSNSAAFTDPGNDSTANYAEAA